MVQKYILDEMVSQNLFNTDTVRHTTKQDIEKNDIDTEIDCLKHTVEHLMPLLELMKHKMYSMTTKEHVIELIEKDFEKHLHPKN